MYYPRRLQIWILALALALLFHALVLLPKIPGLLFAGPAAPPRVDVHTVDPHKLAQIRRQWKEREKALLLNNGHAVDPNAPRPQNARYMSDHNQTVAQETRARESRVMPKAGAPGAPGAPPVPPQTTAPNPLPKLGNLGVPLPAAPRSLPPPPRPRLAQAQGQDGAQQSLLDPTLPESAENLLNTEESVYYSFYSRLYEANAPLWERDLRRAAATHMPHVGAYATQVDIILDSEGNLIDTVLVRGSGNSELDQIALASWHVINRYPNPPRALLDSRSQVHIVWTYHVDVGQGSPLQMFQQRAF